MATFSEIKSIRLQVDDPPGYQDFLQVATDASLPATPAPYTAYNVVDTGAYKATEKTSGAVAADYSLLPLRVSDSDISGWIDTYGAARAKCYSIDRIISRLGREIQLKKSEAGAESIEWTALKDLYEYYKGLAEDCKEDYLESTNNSTGRYGTTVQPEIAGGEL